MYVCIYNWYFCMVCKYADIDVGIYVYMYECINGSMYVCVDLCSFV